jgi:hypothetical protein
MDESVNVLLTQAMLYHFQVAETTEITADNSYSKGKINTLLYNLCSVQYPHFFLWVENSSAYNLGGKINFFAAEYKIQILASFLKANTI